jgi:hypothetical protein
LIVSIKWAGAAFAHSAFTGISRKHLGLLLAELRPAWRAAREGRLHARRGRARQRAGGAGRRPRLTFPDRVLVTLAHLRLGIPHEAIAVAFGVDRSTVTRAIGQIRPLLANRGFATRSGVRLRTLADVFAYAAAEGIRLRLDRTEMARHLEWQTARKAQSSQRIPVEHAIAEAKWWRVLQRFTGRCELLPETVNAVAGIVSDRAITW